MKCYLAECIGTFVLVLIGCGAAVLAGDHVGFVGVALAFGLAVLAMVYTLGPISGCHLNPAVTLSLMVSGKFPPAKVAGYFTAQILGGILAAAALYLIASGNGQFNAAASGFASNGYGVRSPGHYGLGAAFVCELLMTAVFVLTILGATDIKAPIGFAGLAIGLALTAVHLVSIPVTNTSVNPARSIGPALFAGPAAIGQLWLFIVAPLLGGTLAAGVYRVIRTIDPVVQLPMRVATQALPEEQDQRLSHAAGLLPTEATPLESF